MKIESHRGLPIVTPIRAWIQCAELLELDDLVAMGDALLSKWSPYAPARYRTHAALAEAVNRCEGRRGVGALRKALLLIRPRVWSPKETQTRLIIVRCGRAEPEGLNEPMFAADGLYLGKPDISYRSIKVAIEYEGDYHRTSVTTFRDDTNRRERFADAGWRTLRVTQADLDAPAALEARFLRYLPPR